MAECQLHRVGTAGLRAPVHQFQLQWSPATYSFVQRLRHSDSADGRAERAHHQHRRVAGPAHRVNTELAAIYWREDPHPGAVTTAILGGVEGLLLTLLRAPIYVPQAHGSCRFSLRVFPQGLSIHGTSVLLCLTKH